MQLHANLTPFLAALILAHFTQAAPHHVVRRGNDTTTGQPAGNPLAGLSKTAQILLSDTRVDAINNVLTDDFADFVFDFNAEKSPAPPGEGGQIVTANRETFPV